LEKNKSISSSSSVCGFEEVNNKQTLNQIHPASAFQSSTSACISLIKFQIESTCVTFQREMAQTTSPNTTRMNLNGADSNSLNQKLLDDATNERPEEIAGSQFAHTQTHARTHTRE
jgi:hypothetical protein